MPTSPASRISCTSLSVSPCMRSLAARFSCRAIAGGDGCTQIETRPQSKNAKVGRRALEELRSQGSARSLFQRLWSCEYLTTSAGK